jgi:Mg-chelatase subunit ChlD
MSTSLMRRWLAVTAALVFGTLVTAGPAFAVDSLTPNPVVLTLQAGQTTTVNKTLHLDALPGAADIIIAIDTTFSMVEEIAQAKAQATQLCNDVKNAIPGARFAVFDFRDVPDRPATQGVLILTPVFVADCAAVQAAINTMSAGGGGDIPEAYNWVFNKAYSDPVLDASRNPDAVQFLVVLGDAPPHNSPAPAVAPACGNTPPADAGISSDTEIAGLNANDITLLMLSYGPVLSCYQQLAGATGGTAVAGGSDLSDDIIAQIQAAAAHVDEVHLEVVGPCALTITFSPTSYTNVTTPVDLAFMETITAPTVPGVYTCTVRAVADGTTRATQQVNVTVIPGPPATLTLAPKTDTNTVDAQHCVTATVKDAFGNPTPGITVRFSVIGSVNTTGSQTTNASGEATFCYTGPALPGADLIRAYADTNNNNVQDAGEPSDTATKTWVIPTSTAGCKVTYGGRITAANGDKATFGGNAKVPDSGAQGQQEYQDHGPAMDINVHSIDVDAVTCSADGKSASIFGTATINGAGTFDYRIDVTDNDEPGAGSDTYRIRLSNGYDSGVRTLAGGNIQLH